MDHMDNQEIELHKYTQPIFQAYLFFKLVNYFLEQF